MDFASLMSAAISKDKPSAPAQKKYLKRSEVVEQERAAYLAEQAKLEAEKEAKSAAKRKREEEEAEAVKEREEKRRKLKEESRKRREQDEKEEERKRRKRLGLPEIKEPKEGEESENGGGDNIPDEELRSKLRALGEPAVLFGESYKARLRRFQKASIVITKTVIQTSLELVEEKDMKVSDKVPAEGDVEGMKWVYRQLVSYFTLVLTEWEIALQGTEQETFAGKAAWRAWVESKENMVPVSDHPIRPSNSTNMKSSFFVALKAILSIHPFFPQCLKSSKQLKNVATSMPMMATSVSLSAKQHGLSVLPWWVSTNVVREKSYTKVTRVM